MTNPEHGHNPEQDQEIRVSEATAEKKAEELANIREYVFRFMTLEEYEAVLKEQKFPERELIVLSGKETALELIQSGQKTRDHHGYKGWKVTARNLTAHPVSTLNMNAYDIMLELYKEARTESDEKSREAVVNKFRELLVNFTHDHQRHPKQNLDRTVNYGSSWGFDQSFDSLGILEFVKADYQRYKSLLDESMQKLDSILSDSPELLDEVKGVVLDAANRDDAEDVLRAYRSDIRKREGLEHKEELIKFLEQVEIYADTLGAYGFDRLETVKEFVTSDDLSKLDMRKVFQAIGTVPRGKMPYMSGSGRQYQVAMFFDPRGQTGMSDMVEVWTHLRKHQWEKETDEPVANAFLAAVALLPDKELEQKMIEIAQRAKEASVPVYNRDGIRRFPKEKQE